MKNSYLYPAIFYKDENDKGYSVEFPGLPGCITEGDDLYDAYKMAIEAIGLYLENHIFNDTMPEPINLGKVEFEDMNGMIMIIDFKPQEYLRMKEERAVKKTVTIPSWLNQLALKKGLNFSQILQEGLKQHLGIL